MNVSVFLDNKAQLEKMEYNFEKNPEVVYRGLLALLSGEINYLVNWYRNIVLYSFAQKWNYIIARKMGKIQKSFEI